MKRGQIYVAVVLLALGVMLTVQLRTTSEIQQNSPNAPTARAQELTWRLKQVKEERDTLLNQVRDLRTKMDKLGEGKAEASQALKEELKRARIEAGLIPVRGAGVQVTLNDSPKELQPGEDPNLYILHEEDLLKVINELRAGGAEAISINEQRLLATSEIRCAGNTILVNTKKIVPPVVILATGDPNTLKSGLEIKGGIFEQLQFWGLVANVEKKQGILIPAYSGPITLNYTKPAE